MKTNRASGFALVVVGLSVVAACSGNQDGVVYGADGAVLGDASGLITHVDAGGQHDTGTPDTFVSTFVDSGNPTPDTGTHDTGSTVTGDTGGGGGGACPATCTADSDCSATCPATAGAVNCCDTVTSACFQSASTVCPDQQTSSSGDGGAGY